jgi:hypothetical protein
MFRRERHRLVGRILAAAANDVLERCSAGFGGGTRIALVLDEYRESHDMDFLCSDTRGYAELRSLVRDSGPTALIASAPGLVFPREPRIDQYGVRFPVMVDGVSIRFEVVNEGRIAFGPFERPPGLPVPCLGSEDCFAEKLLANSDRWTDRDVLSRDLIDLAMMAAPSGAIPALAMQKAERAYGSVLRRDLDKARDAFLASPEHRERCFRGLGIDHPGTVVAAVERLSIGGVN